MPDNKLRAALQDERACQKRFGKLTKKIQLRLASLSAAESLATFYPPLSGPERCHELIGDLVGFFSIDLKHPYRLIVAPTADVPKQNFNTDRERWEAIKEILIQGIEDTHG